MFWKNLLFQLQYHLVMIPAIGQPMQLQVIGELQKGIDEASGLVVLPSGELVHINDGGNPPCVFFSDLTGKITSLDCPEFLHNQDWEALAYGDSILYIADIGNNRNKRKDLTIYRTAITKDHHLKDLGRIDIRYTEQNGFPPEEADMNYDVEALIYREGQLHLFTKNRTQPFDGKVYLYSFPAEAGEYVITRQDSFQTKTDGMLQNWVTGADLNPTGNILALQGYYKLWLFYDFPEDQFFKGRHVEVLLNDESQKEAVCFTTDSTLLITDERSLIFTGGRIYEGQISSKMLDYSELEMTEMLSPNEIDSIIEVKISHTANAPVLWEIFNVKGERVLFGKLNERNDPSQDWMLVINASDLPPGGYVLSIILDNRPYAYKLKKLLSESD